ncbi:family 16 glycosylhydrolase [Carboxylicivirga sp. M1479]|uniref:glycoside hydrolase family 16 protein n=1 Tax=Carboxylicivirga sp. M1479 TaxID=2594476 RepID=UPI001177C426|nr:glycoside hydrolase family 16 protein [Carboxylicivirga sp. M1479]TRX65861.1 glycoside hydrolase family 16 protein [Carboxylicivirga sp. M1479]
MALFSSSKYPSTDKYEAQQQQLISDFERFSNYKNADELHRINELKELINSNDFTSKVEKLKKDRFKNTSEFKKESDYLSKKKSAKFKTYFKYLKAGLPERVKQIASSDKLTELTELIEYVASDEFATTRQEKGFKKTDAYKKLQQFKRLKKDSDIKFYNKQIKSPRYNNYIKLHDSDELNSYLELEKEVTSEAFLKFKSYMNDKKKYHKSEEFGNIQEYNKLLKSSDYLWFIKTDKSNQFDELNNWTLCFDDSFDTAQLNKNKWITGYYWGKALLNKTYVLENEKQFFIDDNIELNGSGIQLNTKATKTKGLVWDSQRGFMPKDFDYSSAIISSGQSHRQRYGKFEAKIKVEHCHPVSHAFWMVGEKVSPQIDIFRFGDKKANKLNVGIQTLNGQKAIKNTKTVKGAKFNNDYFIYSLEWTKEKLCWFINGVKVHEQTSNIPNTPMYLVFSSHITQEINDLKTAANMKIKWVRCYNKTN